MYHYNQCLYYMKGLAEWVGVWDVDEFLTPRRGPPHTLLSVLDQYAAPEHNGGRAVGFLLFTSYSHALPLPEAAALAADAAVRLPLNDTDTEIQWVGRRFARTREDGHDDMYQKSLLSARYIYFTGFHLPGACTARADPERDWGRQLRDDDPEYEGYAKRVAKEVAAVFHFRVVLKPITYVRSKVRCACVGVVCVRRWMDGLGPLLSRLLSRRRTSVSHIHTPPFTSNPPPRSGSLPNTPCTILAPSSSAFRRGGSRRCWSSSRRSIDPAPMNWRGWGRSECGFIVGEEEERDKCI